MAEITNEYIEKVASLLTPKGHYCIIPSPTKLPKIPRYKSVKIASCFLCAAQHRSIIDALILAGVSQKTIANYINKYKLIKGKKAPVNVHNVMTHAGHLRDYFERLSSEKEEAKIDDGEMLDILLRDYKNKIKRREELSREDKKMILDIIKTKAQLASSKQTSLFEEVLKKINE